MKTSFYIAGFALLAFFDTITQVSLKYASMHLAAFWITIAVAGYLGAFVTWMTVLEHAPVGPAFAASHLDVVTVLLISIPLFGERLTVTRVCGALCILAGIALLARATRAATADGDSRIDAPRAITPANRPESPAAHQSR